MKTRTDTTIALGFTYCPQFLNFGAPRPYDGAHEGLGDEDLYFPSIGVFGLFASRVLHGTQQ